jgi:peptidyl-prolyl cis-trans isomerase SurA
MRIHKWLIVLISSFYILLPAKNLWAVEDAIIAVVNDEIITLKDLKTYIHSTYVSLIAEGLGEEQLRQAMLELEINGLDRLIEDKLILSRANKVKLEVKEKLIDNRVEEIKKRYPSEDAFMDGLINNGATLTDLRNKISDQLKIKYVVEFEVKKKIFVNPQEVTDFYDKNKIKYIKKEQVSLDSIFIRKKKTKEDARAKIDAAYDELQKGKDFKEVAAKYSDAPSLGVIEKGQTIPIIDTTVFALKEGQISPVVEVETGFYIFKLTGRKPAEQAKLSDVKDSIYNAIYHQKFKKEFESWLNNLKKEAYIEIKK